MPFFSIIIPLYNAEKYIKECIDSVLSQTFKDLEIIVVDDGSKDNSAEVVKGISENDNRVRLIQVENGGPSRARNIGIKKSVGEYIFCVDNDDVINNKKFLEQIFNKLKEEPVELLQLGATYYETETKHIRKCNDMSGAVGSDTSDAVMWVAKMRNCGCYEIACWSKVFKSSFIKDNELYFDENLFIEDMDWNMHFLLHLKSVSWLPLCDYFHNCREGSLTRTAERKVRLCDDVLFTIDKWGKIYEESKDIPEYVRKTFLSYLAYVYYIQLASTYDMPKPILKETTKKIKQRSWITKYAVTRQQKAVKVMYKVGGYKIAQKVLYKYLKVTH